MLKWLILITIALIIAVIASYLRIIMIPLPWSFTDYLGVSCIFLVSLVSANISYFAYKLTEQ